MPSLSNAKIYVFKEIFEHVLPTTADVLFFRIDNVHNSEHEVISTGKTRMMNKYVVLHMVCGVFIYTGFTHITMVSVSLRTYARKYTQQAKKEKYVCVCVCIQTCFKCKCSFFVLIMGDNV